MAWFGIVVEPGTEGENWSAFCPQTSGVCCTTGKNLEDIMANMIEALECYYANDPTITIEGVFELNSKQAESLSAK